MNNDLERKDRKKESQNEGVGILDSLIHMKRDYDNRQTPEVSYKPIEKVIEKAPPEPKSNPKRGLLGKIMAVNEESLPTKLDKEKDTIREEYLKVYKNQLIASNNLFTDIRNTIKNVFSQMLKEDDSYYLDNDYLREEKEQKSIIRAERRKALTMSQNQLVKALNEDLIKHYSKKVDVFTKLKPEDIELVRKVRFTETDVVYTTDDGVYTLDGRKANAFGGYLSLRQNFLTETLELIDLLKQGAKSDKEGGAKSQGMLWLMIEPLVIPTGQNKVLLLPMGYLQKALLNHIDNEKKRSGVNEGLKKTRRSEEVDAIRDYYRETPREIVEGLLSFKKPINRSISFFPYKSLEDFGVEVEFDVNYKQTNYTDVVVEREINSIDYIGWEELLQLGEINNIDKASTSALEKIKDIDSIKIKLENNVDKINNLLIKIKSLNNEGDDEGIVSAEKSLNTLYMEQSNICEGICNYINKMSFKEVTNLITTVEKSHNTHRNLTLRMTRVFTSLQDLQLRFRNLDTVEDSLKNYFLELDYDEKASEEMTENYLNKLTDTIDSAVNHFSYFLGNYKEKRSKIDKIQSLIGGFILNPSLQNLHLDIRRGSSGRLQLAPIMLEGLLSLYPELNCEVNNLNKFPTPIINYNLESAPYEKIRAIIKHFGDREYVNWYEILKIVALAESSLIATNVKVYEDIKSLIQVPELKDDLERLNNRQKFVQPTAVSSKVDVFNRMFNNIAVNKKGLLCSIDYKGLGNYLVSETDEFTGEEFIKYIPSLKSITEYYEVIGVANPLPKLYADRLMKEVPNLPATYLAINHIMSTIKGQASLEKEIFSEHLGRMDEYYKLMDSLSKVGLNRKYQASLQELYRESETESYKLVKLLNELAGRSIARYYSPLEMQEKIEQILEDYPRYYKKHNPGTKEDEVKLIEKGRKYKEDYSACVANIEEIELRINKLKQISEKDRMDRIEELTLKIKEVKSILDSNVGEEARHMLNKITEYYDKNTLENDLRSAWRYFNFDKFSKGKILLNYILTYTSEYGDLTQAAMFSIIRDSLMDYRKVENSLKAKGTGVVDITISLFEYLCFEFKLDRVLRINATDRLEINSNLSQNIVGVSKEDTALLRNFYNGLQGKTETEIKKEFKAFDRVDLIDDDLYLRIVYDNESSLELDYPSWYNADFNIAENIKIMLDCGVTKSSLNPEHLEDKKLMKIVENTEINDSFLEDIRRNLNN